MSLSSKYNSNKKNRALCFFLTMIVYLQIIMLPSCSTKSLKNDKISIVCTAFSQYDFVKEIIGENSKLFDVVYLFENGTDVHNFESTIVADSKIKILYSDIFIYNGGESDNWAKAIIEDKSMNQQCKILSLMSCVDASSLISVSHLSHSDEDHNHNEECFDEHVWLSVKNAQSICGKICDAIVSVDEENKELYENNLKTYTEKLESLNDDFKNSISSIDNRYILVADRFPLAYLFDEYDISYSAAFPGCSAETDATIEKVIELSNEAKKNNLKSILVLQDSNTDISKAIISTSGINLNVLSIDSLQSVSKTDIENGKTYYKAMYDNFRILEEALMH